MANEHALTTWRKNTRLTQEELGNKLGISRWMVNSIETGRRKPSWELAKRIKTFTKGNVTLDDFASQDEAVR